MAEVRLLLACTDENLRAEICSHWAGEGYASDDTEDGITALKLFRRHDYSAAILETKVKNLDGYNVLRQIRKASDLPVLVLGAGAMEEKLTFFAAGADDYLPLQPPVRELTARVQVFLRRSSPGSSRRIVFDGLCIEPISRMVYVDGNAISLTPREYNLLLFLASNPHRAFSRDTLLNKVWGEDYAGTDRTVDTHIKSLRESIKPYQDYIATVWSYGYIFKG